MNKLLPLMFVCITLGLIVTIILFFLAIIGGVNITKGCLLRYNKTQQNSNIEEIIKLKANGNYNSKKYGQWLNTKFEIIKNQDIKLKVQGEVSLCNTYLIPNNLENKNNINIAGNLIKIPKIEDGVANTDNNKNTLAHGLPLIFDAKNPTWRNLAHLELNDRIEIRLMDVPKNNQNQIIDIFKTKNYNNPAYTPVPAANCISGQNTYHPICNISTPYAGTYTSGCKKGTLYSCLRDNQKLVNYQDCSVNQLKKDFPINYEEAIKICQSNENNKCANNKQAFIPEKSIKLIPIRSPIPPYDNSKDYTFKIDLNENTTLPDYSKDYCSTENDFFKNPKFWFDSKKTTGLMWRIVDKNENIMQKPQFVTIDWENNKGGLIFQRSGNNSIKNQEVGYLQYAIVKPGITGGYVFMLKQTKCNRINGEAFDDENYQGRGKIKYLILKSNQDPNTDPKLTSESMSIKTDNNNEYKLPTNKEGTLWLLIDNKEEDYETSYGQYNVEIITTTSKKFFSSIIQDILNKFTQKLEDSSNKMFKRTTCYGESDKRRCFNLFFYIKSLLTLYIVIYTLMMLLGITKITQEVFIINIIKVIIVSGLIDGGTYEFFTTYINPIVNNFTRSVIANIAGYNVSNIGSSNNPFLFLDAVMTRILLNQTFVTQVLSLLSFGIPGILYFLLVLISLGIFVISIFRCICIYIMSTIAIAVLIGMTPIFLTFMLFKSSFYLFNNWVRFTFRYMMEPIIAFAGVIILTQLFTIYLDYALGFSICWKCAFTVKIPFLSILPLLDKLADIPIFCIKWFAPWGVDMANSNTSFMESMTYFIVLLIISYTTYGYLELTSQISFRLTNTNAPSTSSVSKDITQSLSEATGLDEKSWEKSQQKSDEKEKKSEELQKPRENINSSSEKTNPKK